jgi:hypothetical protein
MKGRDELGRFVKGQKCENWNGFKKGYHPPTQFKPGNHPPTEFKKGHKLCCGEDNPRYIDGRSMRRKVAFARSY